MSKKPNIPMTAPISTCRQKVDKEKFNKNWDKIFAKKYKTDKKDK